MCCVNPESYVADQVGSRRYAQPCIDHLCKTPLVIPAGVDLAAMDFVVKVQAVLHLFRALAKILVQVLFFYLRPQLHFDVVMPPCPAPGSPSPNGSVVGEEIAMTASSRFVQQVRTADLHDPGIASVVTEQLLAVGEERLARETIVFQNNSFLDMSKEPVNRGADRSLAAQVLHPEKGHHLAGPVDRRGNATHLLASFPFTGPVMPRSIGCDKKAGRLCLANGVKDPAGVVRAVEYEKKYRRFRFHQNRARGHRFPLKRACQLRENTQSQR